MEFGVMSEFEDGDFVPLQALLDRGISVGDLATAIELQGVYGWDRFDRFKRFAAENADAGRALDALERAQRRSSPYGGDDEPSDDEPFGKPLQEFGWLHGALPDFGPGAGAVPARRRPGGTTKGGNADLALFGGLLLIIQGKLPGFGAHPDYTSNAALIDALERVGADGLGRTTVEKKFAAARKHLGFAG